MTQPHSVTRWLAILRSLVRLVNQGTTSEQTPPLPETRKRADQGDADAQFNLGVMYDNGEGVPEDDTQAVAWYRKAADQGHARAQFNLGAMYGNGQGVPQNFTQAVAWYHKAADQNHARAQFNLGFMYDDGEGVPQDNVEAYKWLSLAALGATGENKNKYAETLDTLAKQMTPAQLVEAQQCAAEWQVAFEKR